MERRTPLFKIFTKVLELSNKMTNCCKPSSSHQPTNGRHGCSWKSSPSETSNQLDHGFGHHPWFWAAAAAAAASAANNSTHVQETDDSYIIQIDVPGIPKENIHVSIESDGSLKVEGERTSPTTTSTTTNTTDKTQQDSSATSTTTNDKEKEPLLSKGKEKSKTDAEWSEIKHDGEGSGDEDNHDESPSSKQCGSGSGGWCHGGGGWRKRHCRSTSVTNNSTKFQREYRLPADLDVNQVQATHEHGVLCLVFAKKPIKKIEIQ